MASGPPIHESLVLKQRDRNLRDSNAWPDFTLTQARIASPDTNAPANLLYASDTSPVTVTGRLEKLPNDRLHYLLPRTTLPVNIQVTNVGLFSYGQYEEGEVALWAAGEAGWFEIKPSRAYRDVFREMVQAVECLYYAADFYRDLDKSRMKKTEAEEVFEQYASEPSHKCHGVNNAKDVFRKHKRFLVTSMENGKEGIAWRPTQLYQWLLRDIQEENIVIKHETGVNGRPTEEQTPNRRPPHAGKGKSTLRPQSGALTIKGAKRRRSLDVDQDGLGDETMEGAGDTTLNGDPEIVSPSPLLKRKGRQKQRGRPARRRLISGMDIDEEDGVSTPLPDDSDSAPQPERSLPLLNVPRPANMPKPKTIVKIVESPLPSYQPQGPGDTWTCTFDGCSHRVYAASEPESRELIKEHFRSHAFNAQAQIDLVYKEERPYLPVGNLIKKIRDLAALQRGSEPAEGGAAVNDGLAGWPQPVVRKY